MYFIYPANSHPLLLIMSNREQSERCIAEETFGIESVNHEED